MMASNILSRFLPPATGSPSVYETLRQHDQSSDQSDVEERAGMALDEESLGVAFQDHELDDAIANATANPINASMSAKAKEKARAASRRVLPNQRRPHASPNLVETDDLDDDVPLSLLIEGEDDVVPAVSRAQRRDKPLPVPGPANRGSRAKWQATQEQQQLHQDPGRGELTHGNLARRGRPFSMLDPKEKAMWRWANVENLDNFLKEVYDYFLGNGIWCIILSRMLNLL